jgi:hypothetical protein
MGGFCYICLMAYFRTITRPIKTLSPPSMGQDWNSPDNSNPSSFNDLANQYRAIDQAGWPVANENSQNVGGRMRPLCGDFGPTYAHTTLQVTEIDFEIAQIARSFSLVVYCRAFSAAHYLKAELQIERLGIVTTQQIMFENGAGGSLGTAARPWMNSSTLQPAFYSNAGHINDAKLILTSQKNAPLIGATATNQGNFAWDGFNSVQLKLFR